MSERNIDVPRAVAERLRALHQDAQAAAAAFNAYYLGVTETREVGECRLSRISLDPPLIVVELTENGKEPPTAG